MTAATKPVVRDDGATAEKLAENARRLAEFFDTYPAGVELPTHIEVHEYGEQGGRVSWLLFSGPDLTEQKTRAAAVLRAFGGKWDKEPGELFAFTQRHPSGLLLDVTVKREAVCERVVTGQREVTKEVPTATKTVTVTEDVVEWRCHPLLADAEAVA